MSTDRRSQRGERHRRQCGGAMPARRSASPCRNLNFYYGDFRGLKDINLELPRPPGDGADRPLRLREVDAAAHLQPHLLASIPSSAPRARSCSTGATSCLRASTSTSCAPASAWCSRSRRRSRCRSTTTSPSASGSTRSLPRVGARRPRRGGLAQGRALGRGQGQAAPVRHGPLRRPAAAPVHRAHDRAAPRGDPPRRADLGARSDLDRARSRN